MYIIANGGLSSYEPKNTMEAILLARNASYVDGVLLDIRLTLDNQLVVHSEDDLSQLTFGNDYISQMTYQDVKKVKFYSKIVKHYIPTLVNVLKEFKSQKILILNLHESFDKNEFLVQQVLKLIDEYPDYNYYIESSSKYILEYLLLNNNNYKIGMRYNDYPSICNGTTNFCDVSHNKTNYDVNTYEQILVHTVNNSSELEQFLYYLPNTKRNNLLIITDKPLKMQKYLNDENNL